jgi:hypothetical protein
MNPHILPNVTPDPGDARPHPSPACNRRKCLFTQTADVSGDVSVQRPMRHRSLLSWQPKQRSRDQMLGSPI